MYGLLGEHLSHSFSPRIHNMMGNYAYKLFEKPPEEVGAFLKRHPFSGINVTIPYKQAVMPYLYAMSAQARSIGAVNTITLRNGRLYGDNTDYFGFLSMLNNSGIAVKGKKVIVLGTGGAALTVLAVLKDLGAGEIVSISRRGESNYSTLCRHTDAELLVNATPVGMYPDNLKSPICLDALPALKGVLDLIYNPLQTKLLMDARRRGIKAVSGLNMLVAQAVMSDAIFFGRDMDGTRVDAIERALRSEMRNIVIVGMPGCGKSSVGRELAALTHRGFIDTDMLIEQRTGRSASQIILERGEGFFRTLESRTAEDAGKQNGMVIATGGGMVTQPANEQPLRQNGITVFLKRDIDALPTYGRPISQQNDVRTLYRARLPLYRRFADVEVESGRTVRETAASILKEVERYEDTGN